MPPKDTTSPGHGLGPDESTLQETVRQALIEDVGTGDLTAALVPADRQACATVISREDAVLCGRAWFEEVFHQLDPAVSFDWRAADGDEVKAETVACTLRGPARALLSGERTALNFLQTLSGTATIARRYRRRVEGLPVTLLDTRKTVPGLRAAQKYAVRCGGCSNHRMGLYDAVLIKENHIAACGSIRQAVEKAIDLYPDRAIEVEVETLDEVAEALAAGARRLLLDNFAPALLRQAVALNAGRAQLEASGGITLENVRDIAETGVDAISIGALTKDVRAVDLSMRLRFDR